tara:strand:+ start:680 stop:988 length:309 start_codon:yes stop_codon:yes gene_type:complete
MREKTLILWRQLDDTLSFSPPGERTEVVYDADAPCRICGEPVIEASMGGTNVCPWCDCGRERPSDVPETSVAAIHSTPFRRYGSIFAPADPSLPNFLASWKP